MIFQAFCFYIYHSWKNSLLTRFRRLRQPKYLFSAIVGVAYFYFFIFIRGGGRRHGAVMSASPESTQLIHLVAAAAIFLLFLTSWIFPRERAALVFTEAEIAFLFPAPIGRRTLINFKLLRTQIVILFSAIMFTIFGRAWVGSNPLIRVAGWWIVLATMSLHTLGSSFAVTSLSERGVKTWTRSIVVITIIIAGLGAAGWYTYQTAPPMPDISGRGDLSALKNYLIDLSHTGAIFYLLLPFYVLLAPFFATNWMEFATAVIPALLILALHYWWVMSANVSFEEASIELSRKTAERISAMRAGQWGVAKPKKAKRSPFTLSTDGSPAIAIFWKNLISTGQIFSRRFWLLTLWLVFICAMLSRGHVGWAATISICSGMLTIMSLFFGPQIMRQDLRQDLPMIDVLKIFPMRGWQVVLGEVLTPAVILAGFQWILIGVFLVGSPSEFGRDHFPFPLKLSCCIGAAFIFPCLDMLAVLLQNTGVLLLPAWFQFDKTAPRGIETMGQQLILVFGQILALAICLLPAALVFGVMLFVGHYAMRIEPAIVFGSIAAAGVMCIEVAFAVRILGGVFERFDLSAELNAG
jgi:ABC-2 type transport system permease protein